MAVELDYPGGAVRPAGPLLRLLSRLPAVGSVQAQVPPYAEAWRASNHRALAGRADLPLWVALGDSLTQGVGASAYDRGYLGQLSQRLLPEWPHRLVNLSAYGARVDDVAEIQLVALEALVAQKQVPILITCLAGSNDLVSKHRRRALTDSYRSLLARLPGQLVVANLPNPTRAARELDALLRAEAAAGHLHLADLLRQGPRAWRGMLASDRFHPNDRGYAALADVLAGPVRAALAGRGDM